MSLKLQFLQCTLVVVLYLVVCVILMKVKSNYYKNKDLKATESEVQYLQKLINIDKQRNRTKILPSEKVKDKFDEFKSAALDPQAIYFETYKILQQIPKTCRKHNLITPIRSKHFLYNRKHKSLYCWIRKVASTSFTKLFMKKASDVIIPKNESMLILSNNTDVFKFLLVRHPFERLVSSYRDRLEDNSKYTAQAWIYARRIFSLTRPNLFYSNKTTGDSLRRIFDSEKRLRIVPTFREFIKYLLKSTDDDIHWALYYKHCSTCSVKYNFILKLNDYTLGQINFILSKFGLNESTDFLPNFETSRGGFTDFEKTCKYFATLAQDDVLKLYEKYKVDFEMFDYNLTRYIQCANKSE
ncbi:carbohydrate sulfotransferase 11-like [Prorops nasuta]|uniref:carbohydrate sulfotransferase 11-like n=1 Tax=Prorops nasuta TaxID=863751 RepID=UPI0034CE9D55